MKAKKYLIPPILVLVAAFMVFHLSRRVFGVALNTVAIINNRDVDICVFAISSAIDIVQKQAIVHPSDPNKFSPRAAYGNIKSRIGRQIIQITTNSGVLSCEVDVSPNDCYIWIYIKNHETECICDDISGESGTR